MEVVAEIRGMRLQASHPQDCQPPAQLEGGVKSLGPLEGAWPR